MLDHFVGFCAGTYSPNRLKYSARLRRSLRICRGTALCFFPLIAVLTPASVNAETSTKTDSDTQVVPSLCPCGENVSPDGKDSNGERVRITLTVWTSASSPPCRQFWNDLRNDAAFREAMRSRFAIQWIDFNRFHDIGVKRGVTSAPTFEFARQRVSGYRGKQWLWDQFAVLIFESSEAASPQSHSDTTIDATFKPAERSQAPLPPLDRNVRSAPSKERQDTQTQSPLSDAAQRNLPLKTSVTLPTSSESSRQTTETPDAPLIAKTGEISPQAKFKALTKAETPVKNHPLRTWIHRSAPFVLTGLQLAGILGGTAATGGLGTFAIAALWQLWRRRRTRRKNSQTRRGSEDHPGGEEGDEITVRAPFPRQLDETCELLALRQSEGRVATLDALRGMFLDDELAKLVASANAAEVAVANQLKSTIDARVDEVAPLSTAIE